MKRVLILFSLLITSILSMAQTATVTGTVIDPDGQAWYSANVTLEFVPTPNSPGPFKFQGGPVTQTYIATTNGSGIFSIPNVARNDFITPSQSFYRLKICPYATAQCMVTKVPPITASSVDLSALITANIQAIRINVANNNWAYAYGDTEMIGMTPGSYYFSVTGQTIRWWDGSAWHDFTGGGSGSFIGFTPVSTTIQAAIASACGATPVQGVYIPPTYLGLDSYTNTCNTIVLDMRSSYTQPSGSINVRNFGADGTGIGYQNMVTNSASHNVSGCFNMTTAQVVGKYLHVLRAGPAGGIFKSLVTSISGSTCTVADLPTASVTAGGWVASNDDDGPAFQAAINQGLIYGQEILIPPGNYFIQEPITLPAFQSGTVPWTINTIHLHGLGGNSAAHIYYVQNSTTGPMRAIIEGPKTRTVTTSWSQTGTSVTVNMASNPYNIADGVDFYSPTAGHLNSGDYSAGNIWGSGVTGGYTVLGKTATSITFIVPFSQTASATEVGELSKALKPVGPGVEIDGIAFHTLDYPSGGKTGTYLANGIDMIAYQGTSIHNNFFYQLADGIRMYNSWLGVIRENEFQGPNIPIHFPSGLGPVNSMRVEDNNLEACYGVYGILAEANQSGGSFENYYGSNELEGTCQNTRADIRINGGGNIFVNGYNETAGSQEATYYFMYNTGYGNYTFHFPVSINTNTNNTTYSFQSSGGVSSYYPPVPATTYTRVAAAGSFPSGRDVYAITTFKASSTGYETNPSFNNTVRITNTASNDQLQVTANIYQDWTGTINQFCVYEFDQVTGLPAPTDYSVFKLSGCGTVGSPLNINSSATGAQSRPVGWGIYASMNGNIYLGINPSAVSASFWDSYRHQIIPFSGDQFLSPTGSGNAQLITRPDSLNTTDDFNSGQVIFGGASWTRGQSSGTGTASYPTNFMSSSALVTGGMVVRNDLLFNASKPYENNWGWICQNGWSGVSGVGQINCSNPIVQTEWKRFGEVFSRATIEGTTPPVSGGPYVQGDYMKNLTPAASTTTIPTIIGWTNIAGGSPGTWKPVYAMDPAAPPNWGFTTPATGTFTNLVATQTFTSLGSNNLGTTTVQANNSVNPLNVGFGPLFVFDATDGVSCTSNGANVSTWTDQSPHHYNLTPSSGTNIAPICNTNVLNGNNAVNFNGSTQGLTNTSFAWNTSTSNGGATIFLVFKKNITGVAPDQNIWELGTGLTLLLDFLAPNSLRCWLNGGTPVSIIVDDTNWRILECDIPTGVPNQTTVMRLNGTQTSQYFTTGARTWNDSIMGLGSNAAGTGARANISVAYFTVYDSQLSSTDRRNVITYLSNRFGISGGIDYAPPLNVSNSGVVKSYIDNLGRLNATSVNSGVSTLSPLTVQLSTIASGPLFICDANAQSYTDGQSVTTCTDTGSGAHNATSVGTAPIYKASITPGGKPVIRFNGTGYLQTGTFTLNPPATFCGIFKSGGSGAVFTQIWDGKSTYSIAQEDLNGSAHLYTNGNNASNVLGTQNPDQNFHVFCSVSVGGSVAKTYQDGFKINFSGGVGGNVALNGVTIGANGAGTLNTTNDLPILAVWNSALSDADILNVYNVLSQTYLTPPVLSFDASLSNNFKLTLTQNYTSTPLLNAAAGQVLSFTICQNTVGNWIFTPPNNVLGMSFIPPTPNTCWSQRFLYDGTNANAVGPLMDATGFMATTIAPVSLTTQAASIGTTNLIASAGAGQYQFCYDIVSTQAATTSSSILITAGWNNGTAKTRASTAITTNTVGDEDSNCFMMNVANATAISYSTTYASVGGTPYQYSLRVNVRRIQ